MNPTIKEKEYMQNLAKELFINYGLKRVLDYDLKSFGPRHKELYKWYEKEEPLLQRCGIEVANGETKLVIIDSHMPQWVVKISFKDSCFNGNYCEREADFYKKACECGLGEFFAGSYYVGEVCGFDLYAQEYAKPNEEVISESFYDYVRNNSGYCREDYEYDYEYDEDITDAVCDMNDEDRIYAIFESVVPWNTILSLVDFINENEINDLHSGNWGITIDNRVVIFDYSGYYG